MRLIDADALYDDLEAAGGTGAEPNSWDDGYDKGIDTAIRHLKKAPTVRIKGRWEMEQQRFNMGPGIYCSGKYPTCTVCGGFTTDHRKYLPFCPNCGVEMTNAEVQT